MPKLPKSVRVGEKVTIFKAPRNRNWQARWWFGGRHVRSLGTDDYPTAVAKAMELDAEVVRNGMPIERRKITIREAIDEYITHQVSENRAKRTIQRYVYVLNRFEKYALSQNVKLLSDINARLLDKYRASRKGKCAEKTRYFESATVKQLTSYMKRVELLRDDPLDNFKIAKPREKESPSFTLEQVEQIILNEKRDREKYIYEFLAFTGMRVGELAHLEWEDINWERGTVMVRCKEGWETKNKKDREIPLHDRAYDVLQRLPRHCNWVFPAKASHKYPDGDGQLSDRRLLRLLKRTLERLGYEGRLHSFRHFFASYFASQGVTPFLLMKWLGHSSLDMVLKYYHDHTSVDVMKGICQGTPTNQPSLFATNRRLG